MNLKKIILALSFAATTVSFADSGKAAARTDTVPDLFSCVAADEVQNKWEPSKTCDATEARRRFTSIIEGRCLALGGELSTDQYKNLVCRFSSGRVLARVLAERHRFGGAINVVVLGNTSLFVDGTQPGDVRRFFALDCALSGGKVDSLNRLHARTENMRCKFEDHRVLVQVISDDKGFTLNLDPSFDRAGGK